MARSRYQPSLQPGPEPVFLRLARAIQRDITEGRLLPDARLPGSRSLADRLGLHRNTIVAAYRELTAQGWVVAREGSGSFVAALDLPSVEVGPAPTRPAFRLRERVLPVADPPIPTGALDLLHGAPDPRLLPARHLGRAYRDALRRQGPALASYGSPFGDDRLREAIAQDLRERRGLRVTAEHVLITRGSQMALWIAAQLVLSPGDAAGVEALGYRPAWQAMEMAGAHLLPLPIDSDGLVVDALAEHPELPRLGALYLTPHHQYPTGVVLSPARRLALLDLAARHRFAILEDDYDHEFHYEGRPLLPLASSDHHGSVLYIGTLSKAWAPGIRVGYLVGHPEVIDRAARLRLAVDRQGDPVVERAVALLLEDGTIARHGRVLQRDLAQRRRVFLDGLERHLSDVLEIATTPGGLSLWTRVHPDIDVRAWVDAAEKAGVFVGGGWTYAAPGVTSGEQHLRLAFSRCTGAELLEATRILASTLRRV